MDHLRPPMAQPDARTCFVIMPFGEKPDVAGVTVNFDRFYDTLIVPTIEAAGLSCERADRVDEAGNIHRRMFELIWTADVALVDLSLLNPNVFYELGIRHALRRSTTILIRRRGTNIPFNVSNLTVIEYDETDDENLKEVARKIGLYVKAGYERGHIDNYVNEVLGLRVSAKPTPVTVRQVFRYTIGGLNGKHICIITGDLRNIHGIDIWVNSENTNMQMARYYEPFVSSTIRYEGAEKNITGRVTDDTINNELQRLIAGEFSVPHAHVIPTTAGQLTVNNGVKWIFHVAAVAGSIGHGYRVIEPVEQCVTNALRLADSNQFAQEPLRSILFPLLGISTPLHSERETVQSLFTAALSYLLNFPSSRIQDVYFLAWSESELGLCQSILAGTPGVEEVRA